MEGGRFLAVAAVAWNPTSEIRLADAVKFLTPRVDTNGVFRRTPIEVNGKTTAQRPPIAVRADTSCLTSVTGIFTHLV